MSNERRRVIHFNVTESPTAAWTGQQIVNAFPWDTAPRYLLRDRDGKYGEEFIRRVESMDIQQVPISARSPWQNPYVERVIGSIRRECLNHTIIFNDKHLQRVVPFINSVHIAIFALTSLISYLMLHVTSTISHTTINVEVASCACPGKPRAPAST